ncbi:MAG: cation transporter [Methanothrix sp.]|nr:cation transporter [Methanothrix sp.]
MILTLNLSVALLKGSYGLLTNSLSMSADGLHSLFDSSSNIIGLVGITLALSPGTRLPGQKMRRYQTSTNG